jgi:transposase-like protein
MKKKHRISQEIKEQILKRIKEEGISVADASREHGVKENTIYSWLSSKVKGQPTLLEYNKLKKENQALKELLGSVTLKLSTSQKKS